MDSFVARIDAPRLGDIDITFFCQPTMDASQLGRFVERIETQTPFSQAEVRISELFISVSFTRPWAGRRAIRLDLRIACEQSDWQLSSIAQICDQLSPFTFRVEDLRIFKMQLSNAQGIDMDPQQWLKLILSFGGVKHFYVDGKFVKNIFCALDLASEGHATVPPPLLTLYNYEPGITNYGSKAAIRSFTIARTPSSRTVQRYARDHSCNICPSKIFSRKDALIRHLVVKHRYRLVCPYCGNFDLTPPISSTLFREHLASKHPAAHTNTLILNAALQSSPPSYSDRQVTQNEKQNDNMLLPSPDPELGAFTMLKAPPVSLPESPTDNQTRLDTVIHLLP
ncbi:hypothetical protein V8E53_000495 [Lactarius tabidus]